MTPHRSPVGGHALKPGAMVHCAGCGFNVEPEDAREPPEYGDGTRCETCAKCEAVPDLRESYRRGWNAGLDALVEAMAHTVKVSNLRKHPKYHKEPA